MNVTIGSKFVMGLSILKISGWNNLQPNNHIYWRSLSMRMTRGCWSEFKTEIPSFVAQYLQRHSVISDQHVKKLVMQCCARQYVADCWWLHGHHGGHVSWREPTMRKFTKSSKTYVARVLVCRWITHKIQSKRIECVRKLVGFYTISWRIKLVLENYLDEHAEEVWERHWMNLEVQTTLLNTCPSTLTATILKALREQFKENDQLYAVDKITSPVPEILFVWGQM